MKKILVALLIACMVLSCSSAFAAEVTVSTKDALQKAIDDATGDTTIIIAPGSVINGDVTVVQKPGINYTIKGDGSSTVMHGGIIVDGYGKLANEETVVIEGIVFDAEGVSSLKNDAFITLAITKSGVDGYNYSYSYPHNITVRNCTFKDDNATKKFVAVKFNTSYRNLLIEDCTATGLHSLLQTVSGSGTTVVDNATVTDCKNGISFGNSLNCTVKNSTISTANPDGDGYGVRFDKIGYANTDPGNFVTDNTITSDYPVVIRQKEESSVAKKYTITGNTFVVTAEDLTDTYLKDEVTTSPENNNVEIIEDDNDVYFGEIPVVEISFAAGEGTGSMEVITQSPGEFTFPANKFTAPEGKQFYAWDVNGAEYAPGVTITVDKDITVTAVWEPIPVEPDTATITFDLNGGSSTIIKETEEWNTSIAFVLPDVDLVIAPEKMQLWSWKVNGEEYVPGATIQITGDTTITAVWVPFYNITFDLNGGTSKDITKDTVWTILGNEAFALEYSADLFIAPAGKQFKAFLVNGKEYKSNEEMILSPDTVIKLLWEDIPAAAVVTPAPTAAPAAPKTGDNTNLTLWMALMAISAVALVGLRKKSKASK